MEAIDCGDAGRMYVRISLALDWGPKIATDCILLQIRETVFGPQGYVIRHQLFEFAADCDAIEEWIADAKLFSPRVDPDIVDFSTRKSEEPVGEDVVSQEISATPADGPAVVEAHEVNGSLS